MRYGTKRILRIVLPFIAFAGLVATNARADSFKATVTSERDLPDETPVTILLKEPLAAGNYDLIAKLPATSAKAQAFKDQGKSFLTILLPKMKKNETVVFEGFRDMHPLHRVSIEAEGRNLRVSIGKSPFTRLVVDDGPKPYLYPVIGPSGLETTRAFPMKQVAGEDKDHPHQRSFWFTHGSVNGVDFWAELKGHGSIHETARPTVVHGTVVGLIRSNHDWLGADGKKICEDDRLIRIYAAKRVRILDFDSTITASNGPVVFGDTKEGSFGLRVASSMDANRKTGGKLTNAEGLINDALWGKASAWVDYSGPVEGKTIGVAIFDHPESFRHPTTWHARTYGLFAANPFGWHDFGRKESGAYTLEPNRSISFHYRVFLHDGDTASADIPKEYEAFAHPPKVEISIKNGE